MSTESILGKPNPDLHFSPDGGKVGYIVAGVAAGVSAIAGGTTWFIYSPQAAHLRERAAHLLEHFGLTAHERNTRWSLQIPDLLEDDPDALVIQERLQAGFGKNTPVISTSIWRREEHEILPSWKAVEVEEFSIRRLKPFRTQIDFQPTVELPVYTLPLPRGRNRTLGFRLQGLAVPKEARIPVKGVVEVTHGSERYLPSEGWVKGLVYGIVGTDMQTLSQLEVDETQAKISDLAPLRGKIIFVPLGETTYKSRQPGRFSKTKSPTLDLIRKNQMGSWVVESVK